LGAPSIPRFVRNGWESVTLFEGRINSGVSHADNRLSRAYPVFTHNHNL
jgi:hypothetical protein